MPEEDFTPRRMHYGIMNGGVCERIGEVGEPVSFSVDDDGISSRSYYRELTADWSGTISFKIPWWRQNRVARILGFRALYYVARLRRGGKSHRGKASPSCRAT